MYTFIGNKYNSISVNLEMGGLLDAPLFSKKMRGSSICFKNPPQFVLKKEKKMIVIFSSN